MDNLRLVLWLGLLGLIWACVQTWQLDSAARNAGQTTASPPESAPAVSPSPAAEVPALPALPEEEAARSAAAQPGAAETSEPIAQPVRVRTDVLDLVIDARGGDLRSARLLTYPLHKDQPDIPVQLLSPSAEQWFVFRTGLRAADGQPEPNHQTLLSTSQTEYQLGADADALDVILTWGEGSVVVDKIYHFRRGRYDIGLEYRVRNQGAQPYRAASYLQIQRRHNPPERSYFDVDSYSFTGPVAYDGDKYEKLDVEDLAQEPFRQNVAQGWIAAIQHHFLAAAVPPAGDTWNYEVSAERGVYTLGAIGPLAVVEPGAERRYEAKLFVGPKLQRQLDETAEGLKLTVDYGMLTILAQPLFWLLQQIHNLLGNWGWAIVLATLLIKVAFYKLTETSGRSMAKMRKLQPRMKALQERFKDDRQAMSQALMELYKREKVNPAAGCLPMLVQIPVFIAYYWVLLESVEMRQAPFALWISDLSSRDPFFILPILMGIAMYVQTSLNPAPPDPMQAKLMKWMPVAFTGMFAFFPAGLVLYWLTNSVLSLLQQWRINKVLAVD
jgi:YidC/Oxa1 family membrane protein insertase